MTDIQLSRPDGDVTLVSVSELFNLESRLRGARVACSDNPNVCDDLWIRDEREVPYHCQIIYQGATPYPTAPSEFPFAETLSPKAFLGGTPFGALCRPPFELAGEVVAGISEFPSDSGGTANLSLGGLPLASQYTLLIDRRVGENANINWNNLEDVSLRVNYAYQDVFPEGQCE